MSEKFHFPGFQSRLKSVAAREENLLVVPSLGLETKPSRTSYSALPLPKGPVNDRVTESPLPLIKQLCETLNAQQISYCHWKSNWKIDQWLTGYRDLDLLIDRADAPSFLSIICGLGFKQAEPARDRVPGTTNFYGFDGEAQRFVHLHVHYQLVIGHDLTKNYHLPIEKLFLDSAVRRDLIPLPAPELEFIVFVLRMVLKYSALETGLRRLVTGFVNSASGVEQELAYLEAKIDRGRVHAFLPLALPGLDATFFETCARSLRGRKAFWKRIPVRQKLQRYLRTYARRPQGADALLKLVNRVTQVVRERVFRRFARKRFVQGGLLIAVVGGDGAGKTTTLSALDVWLSKKFVTKRFHIGKPPRSPITLGLIAALRIRKLFTEANHSKRKFGNNGTAPFPGYVQLLRWLWAGRDRCRLYVKARRFATNGGIALCDRYPLPQVHLMEAPNIERAVVDSTHHNTLIKRLIESELRYYKKIVQPDLLTVLRVNPEIAVKRKVEESESHVRKRSLELWEQNWDGTSAYVIDAEQPLAAVIAQLQAIIWSKL
jgi:thymidylate kinase